MSKKEFFTTGDVSQLLSISRATVSRKFDAGLLQGKKNPITGERLIGRESLILFMKKYNLNLNELDKTSVKKIMLNSQDIQLQSSIDQSFSQDERFTINTVTSGYDALIMISKNPHDIVILDDELDDISCAEVVKSLKRQNELSNLKILCCIKSYDPDKIKEINADDYFIKDAMDISVLKNKVKKILNISKDFQLSTSKFDHNRNWQRIPVNIPAQVEIFLLKSPRLREQANTRIENISIGGAYLFDINLEKGEIPFGNIRLLLEIDQPPFDNWKAECKVVRLQTNGSLNAGVKFVNLSKRNRNQIAEIFG